jgi:hypothetical protein
MGAGFAQVGMIVLLTVIGLPLLFFGLLAALDKAERNLAEPPRSPNLPPTGGEPARDRVAGEKPASLPAGPRPGNVPAGPRPASVTPAIPVTNHADAARSPSSTPAAAI